MPSIQYKMVSGLFKLIGVNKMLDKTGADFDKLLETYKEKQKKPLKIPYKKMADFDIETKIIDGTTCYVVRKKGASPAKAVLYLFGGGYILPPDPGDIVMLRNGDLGFFMADEDVIIYQHTGYDSVDVEFDDNLVSTDEDSQFDIMRVYRADGGVISFTDYEEGDETWSPLGKSQISDTQPAELPDLDQIILIYCRSGNRSKQAAQKLADMGYTNIYEFGGINTWTGEIVAGETGKSPVEPCLAFYFCRYASHALKSGLFL